MPRFWSALSTIPLCAWLAACGGEAQDSVPVPTGATEDELGTRGTRYYDCRGDDDTSLTRFELQYSTNKVKIVDISKDAAAPGTGVLDPDYRPTSASYQGASLFEGFGDMLRTMSGDAHAVSLIVSKALKDGEDHKRVWLRYTGGGASTFGYVCHRKTAPLKVALDTRARLACSLSKVACTDDRPPGSTCLFDAFVKQTDDEAATLSLTWTDHFGVNVRDRKENVGASSAFSRTKTKIKGTFEGHQLDLEYRAGVTYLGKLKLPDGRSGEASCSDLAMLD